MGVAALRQSPAPELDPQRPRPSLDNVYRRTFRYVWRTLQRLGVREQDLEDVTQDVFVKVTRKLPQYEPRDRLIAWLAAICFHTVKGYRGRTQHEEITASIDPIDPGLDVEEQAMRDEVRDVVLTLLDKIPRERRIVLMMHDIDEIPVGEIARALGIPENTAKSRLQRARFDFRDACKRLKEDQRRALGVSGVHVLPAVLALEPQALLSMERYLPNPPDGAKARVWHRLLQGDRRAPPPRLPSVGRVFSPAQIVGALGGVFGGGAAVGAVVTYLLLRPVSPSPVSISVAAADIEDAGPASALTVSSPGFAPGRSDASAAPSSTPTDRADAGPASTASASTFAAEQSLIQQARTALEHGQRAAARAALEQHKRGYPRGVLAAMRENLLRELDGATQGQP